MIFTTKIVTFYHQRVFISPQVKSAYFISKRLSFKQNLRRFRAKSLERKICIKPFSGNIPYAV